MWDVITVEEDLEKQLAKVGLSKIKRLMRTANEERADRVSVMLYIFQAELGCLSFLGVHLDFSLYANKTNRGVREGTRLQTHQFSY